MPRGTYDTTGIVKPQGGGGTKGGTKGDSK